MPIEILRGDQARDRLRNPDFLSSWEALYEGCGWGTVFQSPAFACVWYSAYELLYEPFLVYETGPAGDLAGLLPLAVRRQTHELAVCGVPNAEYYVWLARDANGRFFFDALREVWKVFPQGRLRFMFLPPNTPVTELPPQTVMIPIERPFCALDANSASESLRKKSNKSRINRLERMGRLEFVHIGSRAELEPHMDRIAEYCDVRQAAVNGSVPFQDDPPKRDLFLMLADKPSVAHYTALTLDSEVIAVHLGFKNRSEVSLGLIAHAPSLDRHSPGKLLLLFLIEKLAASGYKRFDLTPGGGYKDRFHNGRDQAFRLWVFARRRDWLALRAKFAARRWLKNVDAASGGKLRKLFAK